MVGGKLKVDPHPKTLSSPVLSLGDRSVIALFRSQKLNFEDCENDSKLAATAY
jgi:hypothetical protein